MTLNLKRALVGGLVAGLVTVASGMLVVPVVGRVDGCRAQGAQRAAIGRPGHGVRRDLVARPRLVWLYVAVRPRLGPGPKTRQSCHSSSGVWHNLAPMRRWWRTASCRSGWRSSEHYGGLVELVVAGQVGARLYREV